MPPLQRQDPGVVIQPSGGFPTVQFGLDKMMEARGWQQVGDTMSTAFDMVKREYDRDAVEQAQKDAPALIRRDGTGAVLPVASFEPPGITTKAYRDAYKNAAYNHYSMSVESDFRDYAANILTAYPTDIAAARQKLEEKRSAIVAGLDPNFAPLITLKLNAMSGQIESRINANVQAEQNKVAEQDATRAYDSVIVQAAQLAKTPDRFDRETIAANHAMLTADWDRATSLMRQAGWSQVRIDKAWRDARVKVEIERDSQELRNNSARWESSGASIQQLQEAQLGWLKYIEQRRREMGPDGEAYARSMEAAFAEASRRNGLRVSIDENAKERRRQDEYLDARRLLAAAGERESPQYQEALQELTRRRNAIFTDTTLSTSQRVKALAVADQVLTEGRAQFGTYVADQLTSLYTQATNPETSPQRSRAMVHEIRQIIGDPVATSYLPTGVRNYGERAISQIATNEARTDIATMTGYAKSGFVEPAHLADWGRRMADRGMIGTGANAMMHPAEWAQLEQESLRAYQNRKLVYGEANKIVANAAKGIPPTPADQQIMTQVPELQFRTGDGSPYDPRSTDHRTAAAGHFNMTMSIAEPVKQAIQQVPMGTDPERTMAIADQVQQYKSVLMAKGRDEPAALGLLANELGGRKILDFLSLATRYGHDAAVRAVLSDTNSASRNLGQNPTDAATDIGQAVDRMVGSLGSNAEPGLMARMTGLSPEQKWTREQLGDNAPTLGGMLLNSLPGFGGKGHSGTFQSVDVVSDLRQELTAAAFSIAKGQGQLTDKAHPNVDPNDIAAMQAIERLRDRTELVADPKDPSRGILQWKSAHTRLGEMLHLGRAASEQEVRGFGLGLYESVQRMRREAGLPEILTGGDIDRSKVFITQERSADGSFSWVIGSQYKGGYGTVEMMRLPDTSPLLSAFAGDIWSQAARDMRAHAKGQAGSMDDAYFGGAIVGRALGGLGLPTLDAGAARRENVEERLRRLGYDPADRGYTRRLLDFVSGTDAANPGNWPSPGLDLPATRKAFTETQDRGVEERARNLEYFRRLQSMTPELPR